jgi:transcriptional regulator of acetoin/glycerol metabolism
MVRVRAGTIPLGRLLDELSRPLYVLDADGTIVFANRACLDWVAQEADAIQGQRCRYHSSPEPVGPAAVAAGLCPPPEALSGQNMTGIVARAAADGRLERRRARFVPLASGEDFTGLITLVEPAEVSEDEAAAAGQVGKEPHENSEATRLHERVRSFREQVAARYRLDSWVGDSLAMRRARAQIELATKSRVSVLIVGPPGSGRQHAARAIHYGGAAEPAGSLVPLACSVLEEDLIVSTVAAWAQRKLPPEVSR